MRRVEIPKSNGGTRKLGIPIVLDRVIQQAMVQVLSKELEARNLHYTRYADYTIILVKSEKAANRVMSSITKFIENKLKLKINATKTKVCTPWDLKYLGFGFYKIKKWECIPHKDSKKKFQRTLKRLTNRSKSISLDKRFEELNWTIRGWVNYFRISKMKTFLKEIDEHLRARIRIIIWKQWKIPKTQIKNLVKCGYSIDEAR